MEVQSLSEAGSVDAAGAAQVVFTGFTLTGSTPGPQEAKLLLRNSLAAPAPDGRVLFSTAPDAEPQVISVGEVPAQQEVPLSVSVTVPPEGAVFAAELWAGDRLLDMRQLVVAAAPVQAPLALATVVPAGASPQSATGAPTTLDSGLLLVVVGVVVALALALASPLLIRRATRKSPQQ